MTAYKVENLIICRNSEVDFSHDDAAKSCPVYTATGHVEGEPPEPHTWRFFWYGSGMTSRIEPDNESLPYKCIEIATGNEFFNVLPTKTI